MDCKLRVVLFLMFLSVAISDEENKSEPSATRLSDSQGLLSAAVNELGFKLLTEEMRRNNGNNVVISPTGIAGLLAMTLLGSAGAAYREIATTLGFSQDILKNREHHEQFGQLLHLLTNTNKTSKTSYADAIIVDPNTRIRQVYRDYLQRVYRGEALVAPFGDPPRAKDAINEWVKNNTNGIIEEFLKEPLPANTKAALLSALYFSGQWAQPFLPHQTVKMLFKSPSGDVMADLMLNFGEFKYIFSPQEGLHMIALPYNDSETIMYALKPSKRSLFSLPELMARLNYSSIDQLITRMRIDRAVIRFPKMEIKSSAHLEDSLKHLGLGAIFSPIDANFALMIDANKEANSTEEELLTRVSWDDKEQEIKDAVSRLSNPGVHVDTVLHEVKISINEYGTEAVAATGGFLSRTAQLFFADSPFYMFIRNERTKLVTFSAVIFNPTL